MHARPAQSPVKHRQRWRRHHLLPSAPPPAALDFPPRGPAVRQPTDRQGRRGWGGRPPPLRAKPRASPLLSHEARAETDMHHPLEPLNMCAPAATAAHPRRQTARPTPHAAATAAAPAAGEGGNGRYPCGEDVDRNVGNPHHTGGRQSERRHAHGIPLHGTEGAAPESSTASSHRASAAGRTASPRPSPLQPHHTAGGQAATPRRKRKAGSDLQVVPHRRHDGHSNGSAVTPPPPPPNPTTHPTLPPPLIRQPRPRSPPPHTRSNRDSCSPPPPPAHPRRSAPAPKRTAR